MARIVLGSYMVRYPLGGMMSWVLQYLVGFQRLGHDVYFVEKAGYSNSCYDPCRNVMSDDCRYGAAALDSLLARFDLGNRWCFVDASGGYRGMTRESIEAVFKSADLFIDMGTHGSWLREAGDAGLRVLIDGEPGFTQMKMANAVSAGRELPQYDHYYTTGRNIGTERSSVPTVGRKWRHVFHPVVPELFEMNGREAPAADDEADAWYTTVMNWQSYQPVEYEGRAYGHKDVEFDKFRELPKEAAVPLEVAVSGKDVPREELEAAGWRVRDAHEVTVSFDSFRNYIRSSRGEFSVCKSGYVATNSGWFSDRSAAYLAAARPVVMQETGFSEHLPCGEGLFAVSSVDEAAAALDDIESDYAHHAARAREIAFEILDARKVLGRFLDELRV
jgi:hypothetical protein